MRESIKAVLGFLAIVSGFALTIGIVSANWSLIVPSGFIFLLCVGALVKMQRKKDLAPDFLAKIVSPYFDRDGFCFAIAAAAENGRCMVTVCFQNRYDKPLRGRIAIQPSRELFMRASVPEFNVDIPCEPAAFGKVKFHWPIPAKYQGTKQKFDVGAEVVYPEGKGKILRYRSGIWLRGNAQFSDPFGTAVTIVGTAAGALVISTPASVTFKLPSQVAETSEHAAAATATTLWKLGDAISGVDGI